MKHHIGYIVDYYLDNHFIVLYYNNGKTLTVNFDENTGKPVKRKKTNTLTGVWHTGLWLGTTIDGTKIIAHNHYLVGQPSVATITQFGQGKPIHWDERNCNQTIYQRIDSAMRQIIAGKRYNLTNYNCQHYVNIACIRKQKSESIDNFTAGLGVAASVFLLAGLISSISK